MMNILLYLSHKIENAGTGLVQILNKNVSSGRLTICDSNEELVRILRSQYERYEIAVLWVSTKQELAVLVGLQDLLENLSIILILPDQSKTTLMEAHKLYPRLVSFHDSDVAIVETVIHKLWKQRKAAAGG